MRWLEADRQGVNYVADGIYQRGNFLTWPHERKWQMLLDLDIGLVVNLWLKNDPDLSEMCVMNLPMRGDRVPQNIDRVIDMAAHWMGGGVLVHCEAGVNRSAWFCARMLMARGMPGPEAYFQITQALPRARIHATLKGDLLRDQ